MYSLEKHSTEKRATENHLIENPAPTASRRGLLKGGLAAGFTLAFYLPLRAADELEQSANNKDQFAPNAFIRIDHAGKTTLIMPQVEMGQGVYSAIPQILAEELDADYATVALAHAPPSDKLYGNPLFGIQATAIPIRSALSGSRFVSPARRPGRCWWRRPRHNGRSIRRAVRLRTAPFVTQPAA